MKKRILITLDVEQVEKLDRLCKAKSTIAYTTKSGIIANLIDEYLKSNKS
jgi:metal-responsive CopG/Arc/MetJ family transcriptional regulator